MRPRALVAPAIALSEDLFARTLPGNAGRIAIRPYALSHVVTLLSDRAVLQYAPALPVGASRYKLSPLKQH